MNFQNASDTLTRLANQHQGLIDLAQAMQDLGGLANAKDELTAQVAQLRADTASAVEDYKKAKAAADQADLDIADAHAATQEAIKALLEDAHKQSDAIIAEAADAAAKITSAASDRAVMDATVASQNLAALQDKIGSLGREVMELTDSKRDLEASILDAQAKYDAVKAQIAKLIA